MNREVVMTALFDLLTGPPLVFNFTADTVAGDLALANVSDTSGLLVGMPVSGPGIVEHSTIETITPRVTLSIAAYSSNTAAALTQGVQTASRRLAQPSEEADMPAMYLIDINEEHLPRQAGQPGTIIVSCELWLFSDAGEDPNAVPSSALNVLLDAVERALYPASNSPLGRRQMLNLHGVHYCRIEGEVQKDPGHNGRLAGAIVPIKIMVGDGVDNYPLLTVWDGGATTWDSGSTEWDKRQ